MVSNFPYIAPTKEGSQAETLVGLGLNSIYSLTKMKEKKKKMRGSLLMHISTEDELIYIIQHKIPKDTKITAT